MSELSAKFAAARFKKSAEINYGPEIPMEEARRQYEILRRRYEENARRARQVLRYRQELAAEPPDDSGGWSLLGGLAGAGGALGYRRTAPYLSSAISGMEGKDLDSILSRLSKGLSADKNVQGTLLAQLKGLTPDQLARLMKGESWAVKKFGDVPIIGDYLKKWFKPEIPASITDALSKNQYSRKHLEAAASRIRAKKPWHMTAGKGAIAAALIPFIPSVYTWLKNRINYGPGGNAIAEATQEFEKLTRNAERDRMAAATYAEEMRQARSGRRLPRSIPWDPFAAYSRGKSLTLPVVRGMPGYVPPKD